MRRLARRGTQCGESVHGDLHRVAFTREIRPHDPSGRLVVLHDKHAFHPAESFRYERARTSVIDLKSSVTAVCRKNSCEMEPATAKGRASCMLPSGKYTPGRLRSVTPPTVTLAAINVSMRTEPPPPWNDWG